MADPVMARTLPAERPGRPRRSRRRRLVAPVTVTVVVLAAAVVVSVLVTGSYIQSAVSALRARPAPGPVHGTAGGVSGGGTMAASEAALLAQEHGAVWEVDTLDTSGNPSVGSAFAVVSTSSETLLVTSYAAVKAATVQPAPPIQVRQAGGDQPVTLRTWDPVHDLALLELRQGNEPVLRGTGGVPPVPGQRVYEVSGTGGPNGAITAGKVVAVSATAVDHDAPQNGPSRGGPLIDAGGELLGVASSAYVVPAPTSAGAHVAVPIQAVCMVVLVCPSGSFG